MVRQKAYLKICRESRRIRLVGVDGDELFSRRIPAPRRVSISRLDQTGIARIRSEVVRFVARNQIELLGREDI